MILDKGICTIYRKVNKAGPGEKPVFADAAYHWSWYGELEFETAPARPTENREETRTAARVRVLQCREINNHDRAELKRTDGRVLLYEVTRAYHGRDADSGDEITDLTLEVVEP